MKRAIRRIVGLFRGEQPVKQTDVLVFRGGPGFLDTVEGCSLWANDQESERRWIYTPARCVFDCLPYEDKRTLCDSESITFAERAEFWRQALKLEMYPLQYYTTICIILRQYRKIIESRKAAGGPTPPADANNTRRTQGAGACSPLPQ